MKNLYCLCMGDTEHKFNQKNSVNDVIILPTIAFVKEAWINIHEARRLTRVIACILFV